MEDCCLDFIIDNMVWSFSRLNSFYTCPYEWNRKYINCEYGENGFFGEFGSHCHSLLEGYAKGEISIFEISQKYEEEFNEVVVHDAPPNKYTDIFQSFVKVRLSYICIFIWWCIMYYHLIKSFFIFLAYLKNRDFSFCISFQ